MWRKAITWVPVYNSVAKLKTINYSSPGLKLGTYPPPCCFINAPVLYQSRSVNFLLSRAKPPWAHACVRTHPLTRLSLLSLPRGEGVKPLHASFCCDNFLKSERLASPCLTSPGHAGLLKSGVRGDMSRQFSAHTAFILVEFLCRNLW